MNTTTRFGRGHALNTVYATFIFQLAVNSFAFDERDHFLNCANTGFVGRKNFYSPTKSFGVSCIHSKQVRRKETGFVTTSASSNFKNDVFLVIWVLWDEKNLDLLEEGFSTFFKFDEFLLGELPEFIIVFGFFS